MKQSRIFTGYLVHFTLFFLTALILLISCSKSDTTSLPPAVVPATITSVAGPGGSTSGPKNTIITITGTNFITDLSKIQVKLNGKSCLVLSATATAITAKIPPACGTGIVELFLDGARYAGPVFTFIYSYTLSSVTNGTVGYSDGPVATALLEQIVGISIDGNDNVYIAQYDKPRVRKVSPAGFLSTVAGDGTVGYVNAQGINAKFGRMDFCASNQAGIVYAGDETNGYIRKIDLAGNVTSLTSIPASSGLVAIKVGRSGNIYLARGKYIDKYDPSGTLVWRLMSHGTGDVDGDTSLVQFDINGGLEIDSSETNIYLSEFRYTSNPNAGSKIKKFNLAAKTITTIAGDGTKGETNGPVLSAKFGWAYSMVLDKLGGIYIADGFSSNRIAYLKDGVVTTIIGPAPGDVDGDPSVAKIKYPTGLVFDSQGNLFIGCVGNNKLKKLVID